MRVGRVLRLESAREWDGVLGNTHNFDVVTSKATLNAALCPREPRSPIPRPERTTAWRLREATWQDPDGAALGPGGHRFRGVDHARVCGNAGDPGYPDRNHSSTPPSITDSASA
jgi:hypothetical protein